MRLIPSISFFLGMLITLAACSESEQVTVRKMDLVQGVYASGNIKPAGYYQVNSKVPGILDEIMVSVGQEVEAGTPLLKLQNEPNEMNLQIAKNQYDLALKNSLPDSDLLQQLQQQAERARIIFQQDSLEFERFRKLQEDNIGAKQEYDRVRLKYQTSYNTFQIARSKLKETEDRLQVEVENARSNYLAQKSMTGDYTILSAINGRVYDIIPEEGELIAANRPVMEIGSKDRFEAELQVDETDISLIREGQEVYYDLDALEDSVLSGQITLIYPNINPIERTARVRASVEATNFMLFPGMTLEANIVIGKKNQILILPVEYLTGTNEVIMEDGSLKKVETGIRDLNYVEIVSGLQEGDIVLKPGS
ncbi:efflux RND transporter periplasmic adaptor subunit [Balneola sp. MJW-20]|uniref:efflux RND transporter periplasmic adaptor subunit n=1 Tax=Gracilimonas aurantiaca TaxID=3234185 RepID=UPI0034659786